ncbi:MAG: hypothetical protein LBF12_02705 [Christensenellaceae bacterium]|nr:hypothetical protein [Christensenellaceae bacterium]
MTIDAIRGIVINSFAHAKYSEAVLNHEIYIDPTMIEIFNPGRLPESLDPYAFVRSGVKSQLRNITISNVLFITNMIVASGTGFRGAIHLYRDNGVEYSYFNTSQGFSFEFL